MKHIGWLEVILAAIAGCLVGVVINTVVKNHELDMATRGLFVGDLRKMRMECEAALPRNRNCELVFIPEEIINEPVVGESDSSTD